MPNNAIIRADGTGDYTSISAWVAGEASADYGVTTVGRVDGFFDNGSSQIDFNGTWTNGGRLEPFDSADGFDGTGRSLCGITSTNSFTTIRVRGGKSLMIAGLEVYNTGAGTALNYTSGVPTNASSDGALFRANTGDAANIATGAGVLSESVFVGNRGILGVATVENSSIFGDTTSSMGGGGADVISNTVSVNADSGDCYRATVTQSNNAATDTTADFLDNIVIADNFVSSDPVADEDYRISSGSDLDTNGIGAFIQSGGGSIDSVVDITVTKPVFSISATVPDVVNNATVEIDVTKPVFAVESTNNAPEFNSVVDIEVSKPEFSSTATNSLPQFDSEIAVTVPKPIFASSATVTLPGFNSVVDITITKPEFSVSATITVPEFDSVVDVTIPKPLFSVEASNGVKIYNSVIDFDITKPVFSSVATSTRPDFDAEIDFSVSAPVFSAVAESVSPSNNSVIDVTIQKPIFASVATTTKPEFDATVEIDVTKPVFSVLAINGIITFTFSDETNYNQETLSTNFNQQYLSTNYEA